MKLRKCFRIFLLAVVLTIASVSYLFAEILPSLDSPILASVKKSDKMEWEGKVSKQAEKFVKVITDKREWADLWKRAFDKEAPEVDFNNYAVASVFLGYKADWLYHISFGKTYIQNNQLVIPYYLNEIILELSGPFKAGGQYYMKVFPKKEGVEMVLKEASNKIQ